MGSRDAATDERARLAQAERVLETDRAAGRRLLFGLAKPPHAASTRVQALAGLAIDDAARHSARGFRDAAARLAEAAAVQTRAAAAVGRLAHARGYLAYKRGQTREALAELNRAASSYPVGDRRRAHVFDTLGMHFSAVGDLDRARDYYALSLAQKRETGLEAERAGIAITCGNIARVELSAGRHEEAERWFREDLEHLDAMGAPEPVRAFVHNQLALALLGQGDERLAEAEEHVGHALHGSREGSVGRAFAHKDASHVALRRGELAAARRHLAEARRLSEEHGYEEVRYWVALLEGLLAGRSAASPRSAAATRALSSFAEARAGFTAQGMVREQCEVLLAEADLLERVGRVQEALDLLLAQALPLAERHLFAQVEPLRSIEAQIGHLAPTALSSLRVRRMLGGRTSEQVTGRLLGHRQRLTVWTCDLRGFTAFCDETDDPMDVVRMLNRFFGAVGQRILDAGGRIDKYVGDNILAYFHEPQPAVAVALEAMEATARINVEREHLSHRVLDVGVGIATGDVVAGNVGFAGKLEHTIIGTAVNTACRLVGKADPSQTLLDGATADALGSEWRCRPALGGRMQLKGLGEVRVYELLGRASTERPRR